MKVKAFKQDGDWRKKIVAGLLISPRDLLVTLIMANIIINIFIQNVTSSIFGDFSGWTINIGLPLGLTLIFGEVIPKSIGMANNAAISYRIAPVLKAVQSFFLPVRKLFTFVTHFVSRLLFFFLRKEEEISIDELQHALRTSREFGILNEEEAELVRGFLGLQEAQVKELMRPREEVIFFDIDEPLSKLVHLFVDQECSRIPVCQNTLDNVLGIMTGRLFFLYRDNLNTAEDLLPILKKPFYVPESIPAQALLRQMYDRKESLAIVVDEYGSVCGLISLEDLVEAVVGEIADRRDEKSRYTKAGEDILIASGKLELAEFEEIFDYPLNSENNLVTLGGWITEQLGDIPKVGAKLIKEGFLFQVLAADSRRIRRIYIRRIKSAGIKKKKES